MKRQGWHGRYLRGALLAVVLWALESAQAAVLAVPQKYQEQDQWCWAGCSQAVLSYYGTTVSQTEIAQYGTGGVNTWNYLWGSGTEGGVYRRGIDQILNHFGSIQSTGSSGSLTWGTCQTEIAAGRPPIINWTWSTGGGHFVVLKGLDGTTATLMDPWYGPTVNSYNWVVSGSSHTWEYSLKMKTSPSAGGIWAGAVNLGGGWKWLAWFGSFADQGNGWIYHETLGWQYCLGSSNNNIWMWSTCALWLWSSSTTYPYLYSDYFKAWMFHDRYTTDRIWLYNQNSGSWGWCWK